MYEYLIKIWNSDDVEDCYTEELYNLPEGLNFLQRKLSVHESFYRAEIWYITAKKKWILQTSIIMH